MCTERSLLALCPDKHKLFTKNRQSNVKYCLQKLKYLKTILICIGLIKSITKTSIVKQNREKINYNALFPIISTNNNSYVSQEDFLAGKTTLEENIIPGSVEMHLKFALYQTKAKWLYGSLKILFKASIFDEAVMLKYDPERLILLPNRRCAPSDMACNTWSLKPDDFVELRVLPKAEGNGIYRYLLHINFKVKITRKHKTGVFRLTDSKRRINYILARLKHKYEERKVFPFFADSRITASIKLNVKVPHTLQVISNTQTLIKLTLNHLRVYIFKETPQMLIDHFVLAIGKFKTESISYKKRIDVKIVTHRKIKHSNRKVQKAALKYLKMFEKNFSTRYPLDQLTLFIIYSKDECNFYGWGTIILYIDPISKRKQRNPESKLLMNRCIARAISSQWVSTLVSIERTGYVWPDEVLVDLVFANIAVPGTCIGELEGIPLLSNQERLQQYIKSLNSDFLDYSTDVLPTCDLECMVRYLGKPGRMAVAFNMLSSIFKFKFWSIFSLFIKNNSYRVVRFEDFLNSLDIFVNNLGEGKTYVETQARAIIESYWNQKGVPEIDVRLETNSENITPGETSVTLTQTPLGVGENDLSTVYTVPVALGFVSRGGKDVVIDQQTYVLTKKSETFIVNKDRSNIQSVFVIINGAFYYLPKNILDPIKNISAEIWIKKENWEKLEGMIAILTILIEQRNIKLKDAVDFVDGLFYTLLKVQDQNKFLTLSGRAVIKGSVDMFWIEKKLFLGLNLKENYTMGQIDFFRKYAWRFVYLKNQLRTCLGKQPRKNFRDKLCNKRLNRYINKILGEVGNTRPKGKEWNY